MEKKDVKPKEEDSDDIYDEEESDNEMAEKNDGDEASGEKTNKCNKDNVYENENGKITNHKPSLPSPNKDRSDLNDKKTGAHKRIDKFNSKTSIFAGAMKLKFRDFLRKKNSADDDFREYYDNDENNDEPCLDNDHGDKNQAKGSRSEKNSKKDIPVSKMEGKAKNKEDRVSLNGCMASSKRDKKQKSKESKPHKKTVGKPEKKHDEMKSPSTNNMKSRLPIAKQPKQVKANRSLDNPDDVYDEDENDENNENNKNNEKNENQDDIYDDASDENNGNDENEENLEDMHGIDEHSDDRGSSTRNSNILKDERTTISSSDVNKVGGSSDMKTKKRKFDLFKLATKSGDKKNKKIDSKKQVSSASCMNDLSERNSEDVKLMKTEQLDNGPSNRTNEVDSPGCQYVKINDAENDDEQEEDSESNRKSEQADSKTNQSNSFKVSRPDKDHHNKKINKQKSMVEQFHDKVFTIKKMMGKGMEKVEKVGGNSKWKTSKERSNNDQSGNNIKICIQDIGSTFEISLKNYAPDEDMKNDGLIRDVGRIHKDIMHKKPKNPDENNAINEKLRNIPKGGHSNWSSNERIEENNEIEKQSLNGKHDEDMKTHPISSIENLGKEKDEMVVNITKVNKGYVESVILDSNNTEYQSRGSSRHNHNIINNSNENVSDKETNAKGLNTTRAEEKDFSDNSYEIIINTKGYKLSLHFNNKKKPSPLKNPQQKMNIEKSNDNNNNNNNNNIGNDISKDETSSENKGKRESINDGNERNTKQVYKEESEATPPNDVLNIWDIQE